MSKSLKVVVIGGSSGYGKGVVETFINEGHDVVILSRSICADDFESPELLNEKSWIYCDVTEEDSIEKAYLELSQIWTYVDVVVYSAGIAIDKLNIKDGSRENWEKVFATNTIGLMESIKTFGPILESVQGYLFHIGSIANKLSYEGGADYCASKAASSTIIKTYRNESLGTGVHVSSIEIGLGKTNFQKNRYSGDMQKARKHYSGVRQILPQELGNFIHFVTQQSFWINLDEVVLKPLEQASHGKIKFVEKK